jgi:anaerobic magnesium-protoporphyrin IX monomethyl ester cyclase
MRVTLIYPPIADPRAPQLALPSLAAVLRPAGIETRLLDLNVRGVRALLRRERLERASARLRAQGTADARRLAFIGDHVAGLTEDALAILGGERFFDPGAYNTARSTVTSALDVTAAAAGAGVKMNLGDIRYDVQGADPAVLADLLRVTGQPEANLFHEHWEEELFPELAREAPDLVGITITNRQQILPGLMLARALKSRGHFVVLGGAVYTKFKDQLQARPDFFRYFADGVVVYEGETALLELCRQLEGARRFEAVPNYLFLDGDHVRAGKTHAEDVEHLPTPDFTGLPLSDYFAPAPVLPILTGKGCYFNRCKFCDIPYINHVASKAYRVRSPEQVLNDVRTLSERHGARHFVITDEALSPKLLTRLADAFEPHEDARYRFTGYARLEPGFTAQVAERMAALGVQKVFFGLESASQRMQDHMDKGTRVSEAPAILRNMREAGIDFHLFSIVGFPEEQPEDAQATFDFFVDNRETIDAPGNTFDIHPFGLELRTDYWRDREQFGVQVDPRLVGRDFLIGLKSSEWKNARGLDAEQSRRLIYQEYLPRLRQLYRRWHNTRGQLRPGFEEYSVLYGDVWRGRPFDFATTLPPRDDPRPFRLSLNGAWAVRRVGERVELHSGDGSVALEADVYEALVAGSWMTIEEVLAHVDQGGERRLRERTDALFEAGLLQLAFAPHVESRSS